MRKPEKLDDLDEVRDETGPDSGGQSGDLQGIDDEDVADLLEEGQSFEAGIVSGLDRGASADDGGLKVREVPEDDVPSEYLDDETPPRP
jgi:hypothetical protein